MPMNYRRRIIQTASTAVVSSVFLAPMASAQLYLVEDGGANNLYTVDVTTAALTLVGAGASGSTEGLALSGNANEFFGVSNDGDLYTIARDGSGVSSQAGSHDADRGLAFNTATGILYGVDNGTFGSIDTATNTLTALAATPGGEMEGLAADPVNNIIYGINSAEDLYAYDVASNTWSLRGATGVGDANDHGLAYDPDAQLLYAVINDGSLFSVDPSDGSTTSIGNIGLGTGLDLGMTFVPIVTYSVGGTVSGLTGAGLELQNNGGDTLAVAAAATSFTFATELADTEAYAVTVSAQPAGQTCTVTNGSGSISMADVTNVSVSCGAGSPPGAPPAPPAPLADESIPTMGAWGLGILSGMLALLGLYYQRRR